MTVTDNEIRQSIIHAVQQTFELMMGVDVGPGENVKSFKTVAFVDVSGIMSFSKNKHPMTFVLGFQKETIFAILSHMYQREITAVDDSVRQGVGELTNIIYGQIKGHLNTKGLDMTMSLPTIILGQNNLTVADNKQQFAFLFRFKGHEFYVYFGNENS